MSTGMSIVIMDPDQGLKSEAPEHASHILAARLDHLESRLGREVDYPHLFIVSIIVVITFNLFIVITYQHKKQ